MINAASANSPGTLKPFDGLGNAARRLAGSVAENGDRTSKS